MPPFRPWLSSVVLVLAACSSPQPEISTTSPPERQASAEVAPTPATDAAVAYFAGGCFWGVEHFMEQLDGVIAVESGYMGGHVANPTYEQVASQGSGHFETVRVRYDKSKVSYEALAKRFFEIHDPTQADGQGPDIGPEYRSVVFYASPEQKQTVEGLIAQLEARGYDVATELREVDTFWEAEGDHQDYYARTGKAPYCHARVKRFGPE